MCRIPTGEVTILFAVVSCPTLNSVAYPSVNDKAALVILAESTRSVQHGEGSERVKTLCRCFRGLLTGFETLAWPIDNGKSFQRAV